MSRVVLKKCDSYSDVKKTIRESLKLIGGLEKFIKKGSKVLLKPNLSEPLPPEKAATTHPLIVKAVVELVKELGGMPIIGENAAGDVEGRTRQAFEVCGINKVSKESGAETRNFQEDSWVLKDIPNAKKLKKADFAQALFEVDLVVNLPKFKTHGITFITGALKNMFGCVHSKNRKLIHKNLKDGREFAKALIDIYSFIKPQLTIMDAVVAMEGDEGPSFGNPKKIGYVIVGKDGVAVDAVAAKLTGHRPSALPIIKEAHDRGIGVGDLSKIEILGDELEVAEGFKQSSLFHEDLKKQQGFKKEFIFQPFISERCQRCGACFESCPVGAVEGDAKQGFVINEKKCIQCLCCHEVCANGAIDLNKEYLKKDKVANLRLGLSCNQTCVFCTVANDPERDLSTQEAKQKINYLISQGVNEISFTGGEPTIREDLPELISYANEKGIRTDLQTNGVRFADEKYLSKLKKSGLNSVLIAIHSHKEDVSNKLTQTKFFYKTMKGIKNAVESNVSVSISHVINSRNYKDLPDFVDFISKISDRIRIYFGFIRPNGRTFENKWIVPKMSQIEPYLYKTFKKCEREGVSFSVEGLPLCYMQDHEKYCAESQRMLRQPQMYIGSDESKHENLHDFIHTKLKVKSDQCKMCYLNNSCVGIWREYAQIFGTEELYPVFNKVKW